jgi:hypothetical protein
MGAWALPSALENPQVGTPVAGISLISGWHCSAKRLEFSVDGGPREWIPSGSSRPDTAQVCGKVDNGFGYLLRWNNYTPGNHTLVVYADGLEWQRRTVNVVDIGPDMIYGVDTRVRVENFPWNGRTTVLAWNDAFQQFTPVEERFDTPPIAGTWRGVILERRSNCTNPAYEGNHGTWAQYDVSWAGGIFTIAQSGGTVSCTYSGTYTTPGNRMTGTVHDCSDGKTANFTSTAFKVTDRELEITLAMKFTGAESCTVDATLGGFRY